MAEIAVFKGLKVSTGKLEEYEGNCYLGIDAGSTTTKVALIGEDGRLLYSFYSNNNGSPLKFKAEPTAANKWECSGAMIWVSSNFNVRINAAFNSDKK